MSIYNYFVASHICKGHMFRVCHSHELLAHSNSCKGDKPIWLLKFGASNLNLGRPCSGTDFRGFRS